MLHSLVDRGRHSEKIVSTHCGSGEASSAIPGQKMVRSPSGSLATPVILCIYGKKASLSLHSSVTAALSDRRLTRFRLVERSVRAVRGETSRDRSVLGIVENNNRLARPVHASGEREIPPLGGHSRSCY